LDVDPAGSAPLVVANGAVLQTAEAAAQGFLTFTALAPDRFRAALGLEMDNL
jgi:hypothetical protein